MTESVYLLKYIQKSFFSIANRQKLIIFRKFAIKIKFTCSSQEALFMKIGGSIDKKLQILATLLKMNYFREFYYKFAQIIAYLPQYFSISGTVIIRNTS